MAFNETAEETAAGIQSGSDDPGAPAIVQTNKNDDIKNDILEQRKASTRWFDANYYEEWREIYRNLNAKTKPLMRKKSDGSEEEDPTRTNVCLPDHHVMVRRGVARLTRNGPNLRVRGGPNQELRDKVSGMLMQQWERGEAQKPFRQIVHSGKALGWGIGKSYWDKVTVNRDFRKYTERLTRSDLMRVKGAPQNEVEDAVKQIGDALNPDEQNAAIQEHGDEVSVPTDVTKYEGPVLGACFVGDIFPEPGFQSLNESAYVVELSVRDEQWLKYWLKQTSKDPETGEESPVLDAKACQELDDMTMDVSYIDNRELSLRRQMRDEIGMTDPRTAGMTLKPPKKRYIIDERHMVVNGRLRIDFVGNESVYLGRLWYPWNTYGRYTYSEMVLIPDLLGGVGQSTPRITRFLMQLRNARMNQTTDFINNKLLPLALKLVGEDITDLDAVRTAFMRFVEVKSLGSVKLLDDPQFPQEGWQDQAQLNREMQQVDGQAADYAPGTSTQPQPGKLATSLILQQKSTDSVTADELNCLNNFVRETVEMWLWMNQQQLQSAVEVSPEVMSRVRGAGQ